MAGLGAAARQLVSIFSARTAVADGTRTPPQADQGQLRKARRERDAAQEEARKAKEEAKSAKNEAKQAWKSRLHECSSFILSNVSPHRLARVASVTAT